MKHRLIDNYLIHWYHVPKCMNHHKAVMVITARVRGTLRNYIYMYIYIYLYIYIYIIKFKANNKNNKQDQISISK